MTLAGLMLYIGVYAIAAASPGPAVLALVARVLARGPRGITPFIAGLIAGDLVWLTLAALGLSALAALYAPLFQLIKYAGCAYLLVMAVKLWRAKPVANDAEAPREDGWRLFLGAFSLTLGNPKTMAFFLSIMPMVVDVAQIGIGTWLELVAVCLVVMPVVFGAYALAAGRARRLLRSPGALRALNRGTAGMMAGAAAVIASR